VVARTGPHPLDTTSAGATKRLFAATPQLQWVLQCRVRCGRLPAPGVQECSHDRDLCVPQLGAWYQDSLVPTG
jgi:hypothetical protein